MAYKFHTGAYNTSGALNVENAITGNALLVDTGGITVSNGNINALTAQLTASAISASSAQFGSITVPTFTTTNLDLAGYLDVKGAVRLSGNVALGDASTDIITANGQLTASAGLSASAGTFATVIINGGGIDGTTIGAAVQSSGKFTTLSSSAGLSVGGNALVGGTLTVNGGAVSSINNRLNLGQDGGSVSVSGSGQAQFGGAGTFGSGLTVNGGIASSINYRLNLGQDGGSVSLSGSGAAQLGGGLTVAGTSVLNGNLTVNGTATFPNTVTIKDLYVTGTMTAVQSQDLAVKDAKVIIASGTVGTGSFDALDPAGIYVGGNTLDGSDSFGSITLNHNAGVWTWQAFASGAIDPALQVGGGAGGSVKIGSTTVLSQTQLFAGAVTGSSAGVGLKLDVFNVSSTPVTIAFNNYVVAVNTSTAKTINLPAATSGDVGRVFLIKDTTGQAATNNVTITPNGLDTLDGVNASIKLESNYAAVSIVCVGSGAWALF